MGRDGGGLRGGYLNRGCGVEVGGKGGGGGEQSHGAVWGSRVQGDGAGGCSGGGGQG